MYHARGVYVPDHCSSRTQWTITVTQLYRGRYDTYSLLNLLVVMRTWFTNLLQFEIVVFVLAMSHFGVLLLYSHGQRASAPSDDCDCEERTEWRRMKLSPVIDERQQRLLENNSLQTLEATEKSPTPVLKAKKEPGSERWKVWMWNGFDFTTLRNIRESILENTNVTTHWYCSKDNMPLHSTFRFYDGKQQHKVMRGTYQYLPQETHFPDKLFRTCSVVGNGGILNGGGCGSQIDSADYVFRINLPPVHGDYQKDVGRKANFVTINPSLLTEQYGSLKSDVGRQNFTAMLDSYLGPTTFYTHPFYNINSRQMAYAVLRVVKNQTADDGKTVVWSHPGFLQAANTFWRETGRVKVKRITSGLLVVTIALAMCEETHVYGFWPFSTDLDGNPLNYHYYDRAVTLRSKVVSQKNQWRVVEMNKYHKMKTEHDRLARLHEMGVVRMHVGTCDVTEQDDERS
ncbi:alpha-N-acetylneuraminide alpha-2,8-sialyltransferase-like isoform X2 [Branchiostoma lanceolatum]|uniref:alpha-N-acetylneuraminide alpha-2,8-sialyltransferase-like isoform X2 n=1 Tax=Branchiostoma lanceolatum TaxID=7740 RepID=UPI003451B791